MSVRLSMIAAILFIPALATAQTPNSVQQATHLLHPSQYGESKPAKFPSAMQPNAHLGLPAPVPMTFSERLYAKYQVHICAPDGCPSPLGCGNLYTESKFLFGSCRQFFGTGEASQGIHKHAKVP